ncbi:WD40 repeat-like protein [Serendipita vermifera]|nr:WD40 repeat-like protein [Serendipita vermifera]
METSNRSDRHPTTEQTRPYPYSGEQNTLEHWTSNPNPKRLDIKAHGSSVVTCLLISRGRIISASDDHNIHVYDIRTGTLLHELKGHGSGVWSLAVSKNTLVSGSKDRTVRLWDLENGRCTHIFNGHTDTIRCVVIARPTVIDIEMEDGSTRKERWPKQPLIPSNQNPHHIHTLSGHQDSMRAIDAYGRTAVSGSFDYTVRVWDIVSGVCKWVLAGHTQKVFNVSLDHARDQVYSGSMDSTVRIWSLKTGECVHTLSGHASLISLLVFSPSYLVSASPDSTIKVWDPSTGELRSTLHQHTGAITSLQHDDSKLLSCSDGTVKMWNIQDGTHVSDLLSGVTGIWQITFKNRCCVAATNNKDETFLNVWDFKNDSSEAQDEWSDDGSINGDEEIPGTSDLNPDPDYLYVAKESSAPHNDDSGESGPSSIPLGQDTLKQWMSNLAPRRVTFAAHGSSVVTCLVLSGDRIITSSDDHAIHIYDASTGQLIKALEGHQGGVWALACSNNILVSGSTDRTIRIWDLKRLECIGTFRGHKSTIRCICIVRPAMIDVQTAEGGTRKEKWPKQSLIITGSRDHTLRVWKLPKPHGEPFFPQTEEADDTDEEIHRNSYHLRCLTGHLHAVRDLAAHGRTAVSASYDMTVRVWDIITGEPRWTLSGHTQKVYTVKLDHVNHRAYSGAMDSSVRVWDLRTGECLYVLTGHTSLVGLLGLSRSHLVSAAADATLRVWDPSTGELKRVLSAHTGAITCFQHDEYKVVSGSDGTLKMWDIRHGTNVRDLLTGIPGVWQVAFKGHLCVAASNRHGDTYIDVWDFGEETAEDSEEGWEWIEESSVGSDDEGETMEVDATGPSLM